MNLKHFIRPGKGASDITPLFHHADAFTYLITRLAQKSKDVHATKIACIEGRGFILGSALAFHLHLGLILIRSAGKLKNETYSQQYVDYSGKTKVLEIHKDAVYPHEKVILVDDWVETGETLKAAIAVLEKCEADVVKILAFMDDSPEALKETLAKYNYSFVENVKPGDEF